MSSAGTGTKSNYFQKMIMLTDQGIRDTEQVQFRLPGDLPKRLDAQVGTGIETAINGLKPSKEALAASKKANCLKIFAIIALVVGILGGAPMTYVGVTNGPTIILIIGIVLVLFFVIGIVAFCYC